MEYPSVFRLELAYFLGVRRLPCYGGTGYDLILGAFKNRPHILFSDWTVDTVSFRAREPVVEVLTSVVCSLLLAYDFIPPVVSSLPPVVDVLPPVDYFLPTIVSFLRPVVDFIPPVVYFILLLNVFCLAGQRKWHVVVSFTLWHRRIA